MKITVFILMLAFLANCDENKTKKRVDDDIRKKIEMMIEKQIVARGVSDERVLDAFRHVRRDQFVPADFKSQAFEDYPLPIGYNQTISQPYIVALMTELLELDGSEKVLEIGTGSGYQAAILAECAKVVYTIEIVEPLCTRARSLLDSLNYGNVHVRCGDGYEGWPEEAPFDAVIVTAAPPEIPPKLVEQLAIGGRMVIPVGKMMQNLMLLTKNENGELQKTKMLPVRFVPMTGGD